MIDCHIASDYIFIFTNKIIIGYYNDLSPPPQYQGGATPQVAQRVDGEDHIRAWDHISHERCDAEPETFAECFPDETGCATSLLYALLLYPSRA